MNVKVKATLLLLVWLAAYTVIGGAVLAVASSLLLSTALDDMVGILIAGALTIVLGWLGASWVQRRVDIAITEKTPAAGTSPKHQRRDPSSFAADSAPSILPMCGWMNHPPERSNGGSQWGQFHRAGVRMLVDVPERGNPEWNAQPGCSGFGAPWRGASLEPGRGRPTGSMRSSAMPSPP